MAKLSQIKAQAKILKNKNKICVKEINGKSIEYTFSEGLVQHVTDFDNKLNQERLKKVNANIKNPIAFQAAATSAVIKNIEKDSIARGKHIFSYFEDELCTFDELLEFCKKEHEESAQFLFNNFMKSISSDFDELMTKLNNSSDDDAPKKGK